MLITVEDYLSTRQVLDQEQNHHASSDFRKNKDYISIRTATILLTGPNGKPHRCLAALDTCSNSTNVDADLAKKLGFRVNEKGIEREINFMERLVNVNSDHVSFMMGPVTGGESFPVHGFTIKDLIKGTPVIDWNEAAKQFPHLQKAEIPKTDKNDNDSEPTTCI
jgi:hypothetical protein